VAHGPSSHTPQLSCASRRRVHRASPVVTPTQGHRLGSASLRYLPWSNPTTTYVQQRFLLRHVPKPMTRCRALGHHNQAKAEVLPASAASATASVRPGSQTKGSTPTACSSAASAEAAKRLAGRQEAVPFAQTAHTAPSASLGFSQPQAEPSGLQFQVALPPFCLLALAPQRLPAVPCMTSGMDADCCGCCCHEPAIS